MNVACLGCLQLLPSDKVAMCPNPQCRLPVPPRYFETCAAYPPQAIIAAGYPQHGKTNLINSLILTLENLGRKVEGVYPNPLGQETRETLRLMRARITSQEDTTSTRNVSRLLLGIHGLNGLRRTSDHFVRLYDLPGEMVRDFEQDNQPLPFPQQSLVVWMVVSLQNLAEQKEGYNMASLLQSIDRALQRLQADAPEQAPRTLIVIYTKAEKYSFPPEIENYYQKDPFKHVSRKDATIQREPKFAWREYLANVHAVSEQLLEFTRNSVDSGGYFVSLAKGLGYDLKFCITSALGGDPQDGHLMQFTPMRVIDPLLLSLGLNAAPPPPPPPPSLASP